jgi:retron-type reverse transcriptase
MKRHGHLWNWMISFENLLRAAHAAARGKRFKPGVARFLFDVERQLLRLHEELVGKTYCPGPYRTFTIYEGKTRRISAAPFRDRVVYHALTGVLEQNFERPFIFDSHACRKGKGTSQFFANVYLDPLDHFVTDRLGLSYVRHVDDFLIFADGKRRLHGVKVRIAHFLESLRLQIHQNKSVVFPCEEGIRFLGYRVFPTHWLLAQENVRRFRRRMRWMQRAIAIGQIGFDAIRPRIMSWMATRAMPTPIACEPACSIECEFSGR